MLVKHRKYIIVFASNIKNKFDLIYTILNYRIIVILNYFKQGTSYIILQNLIFSTILLAAYFLSKQLEYLDNC